MSPTAVIEKSTTTLNNTARKALLNLKDARDIAMDIALTPISPEVVAWIDGFIIDIQCGKTSDTQEKYYATIDPEVLVKELLEGYDSPYNRPSREEFEQ